MPSTRTTCRPTNTASGAASSAFRSEGTRDQRQAHPDNRDGDREPQSSHADSGYGVERLRGSQDHNDHKPPAKKRAQPQSLSRTVLHHQVQATGENCGRQGQPDTANYIKSFHDSSPCKYTYWGIKIIRLHCSSTFPSGTGGGSERRLLAPPSTVEGPSWPLRTQSASAQPVGCAGLPQNLRCERILSFPAAEDFASASSAPSLRGSRGLKSAPARSA